MSEEQTKEGESQDTPSKPVIRRFSLKRAVVAIELERDNEVTPAELREMDGSERDAYLNVLGQRVKIDEKGKSSGIRTFDGLQADLISRCLYVGNSRLSIKEIQSWPSSVQSDLSDICNEINKLGEDASKEAKKN